MPRWVTRGGLKMQCARGTLPKVSPRAAVKAERCGAAGRRLHYAMHITGHGWRKLMRLDAPFAYRITSVPEPPEIFAFIMSAGQMDAREAYATFNMGAGFAVYLDPTDAQRCIEVALSCGHRA